MEGVLSFHSRQMVYGDLKPENILVDEEGFLYLTDFGFCRFKQGEGVELY